MSHTYSAGGHGGSCALGARQPDFQSGADRWRVLLDPDGQPFCLSPRPGTTP
ncbi:MAG: VOC family protein [Acidimicrobiales bacterium]